MHRRSKGKIIGICGIVAIVFICFAYFLEKPQEHYLLLKAEKQKQVIEYGEKVDIQLLDYLDFNEIDQDKQKEILQQTEINTDIDKENDYPEVGEYKIIFSYKEESVTANIKVVDTIAPQFNQYYMFDYFIGEELDFDKYVQASDLSQVKISYQKDNLNTKRPGKYTIIAVVNDIYGNQSEKEIKINMIDKPKDNQEIKRVNDRQNGIISIKVIEKNEVKPSLPKEPEEIKKPDSVIPPEPSVPEEPIVPSKEIIELDVPYINQYAHGAPMGCEGASLLQALQGKNYAQDVNLKIFLDNMPYTDDGNPHHGYVSSPYINDETEDIFQSIFPSALTPYGNQYGKCKNTSGYSAQQLIKELKAGHPSVVYVTYNFRAPQWKDYFFGKCIKNMHVMTLIGYNENNGEYKVMDPAGKGAYWVKKNVFETAYNALQYAITVY